MERAVIVKTHEDTVRFATKLFTVQNTSPKLQLEVIIYEKFGMPFNTIRARSAQDRLIRKQSVVLRTLWYAVKQ